MKVSHIYPRAFNHVPGCPEGAIGFVFVCFLFLLRCECYLFESCFFFIDGEYIQLGGLQRSVIKYVLYIGANVKFYFLYVSFF